ncbi:ATP-binding protein [Oxalobacter formigenes]|uniref:ATP-binding protein n=1 Tax=Oxalobacter formigenes TaxID=847 RepID=UPI0022AF160B|nr:ATP-binding protein [Oxalobacter formigenes]WAW05343.1 ATP-binding protein [Oxalobacter formigenes]
MTTLEQFLARAEAVLARVEELLPPSTTAENIDWNSPTSAFRWRKKNGRGTLVPIAHISPISLVDLFYVERQKALLEQNTRQFLQGKPANNVLLTGARGTGKSSLVRACLNEFSGQGLRLIEVDKDDLIDLEEISVLTATRPERFIIYCDDLSFDEGDSSYKALKVALDGSVAAQPDNILIYATSNRRHLLPEKMSDNEGYSHDANGDLHPSETVEEKISFSDRFGLWLSFYPYSQDEYLFITAHWLRSLGCSEDQIAQSRDESLQWALHRGSRSGRTAWQFARDYSGRVL